MSMIIDYAIHFTLLGLFVIGMLFLVNSQMNGAAVWESHYVGEIVKIIDSGKAGDEVSLDVRQAVKSAKKNGIDIEDIFSFDFEKREACVRLSDKRSCLNYFNDVRIVDVNVKPGDKGSLLNFKIVEVRNVSE